MKTYDIVAPEAKAPGITLSEMEIHLIKTLYKGELTAEQQQALYHLLVRKICRLTGPSFCADPGTMARNEGIRLVGIYLEHIVHTPYDKL